MVNADGTFNFKQVPTNMDLYLYATSKDLKYAASMEILIKENAEDSKEIVLVMEPTQSVTLSFDGDPLEDTLQRTLQIMPNYRDAKMTRAIGRVSPDEQGVFHIDGVLPGKTYWVCDLVPGISNMILGNTDFEMPNGIAPIAEEMILVP